MLLFRPPVLPLLYNNNKYEHRLYIGGVDDLHIIIIIQQLVFRRQQSIRRILLLFPPNDYHRHHPHRQLCFIIIWVIPMVTIIIITKKYKRVEYHRKRHLPLLPLPLLPNGSVVSPCGCVVGWPLVAWRWFNNNSTRNHHSCWCKIGWPLASFRC